MAFIESPEVPLRDIRLEGPLRLLVRLIMAFRAAGGASIALAYFLPWHQVTDSARVYLCSGFAHCSGNVLPAVLGAAIVGLAVWCYRAPSLARGMAAAAGTIALSLLSYKLTYRPFVHSGMHLVARPAAAFFGAAFILLTFSGFLDLMFHPILYMWARRDQETVR